MIRFGKQILSAIVFCLCPVAAHCFNLQNLTDRGYRVVEETYVDGDFNGCDFEKRIQLSNSKTFICKSFSYSYSYRPRVLILRKINTASIKVLINDWEYNGIYSGFILDKQPKATPELSPEQKQDIIEFFKEYDAIMNRTQ